MTIDSVTSVDALPDDVFRFKTMDMKHFSKMRDFIDKLDAEGRLSKHEVFRTYIKRKRFQFPESFPTAKSIIVLAIFSPWMEVPFHYKGTEYIVMLPSPYYDDGKSEEIIQKTVHEKIIKESGYKIEKANRTVHLKHLAVRSGLAKYGRNNITYVEGMGSHLNLHAYYTDFTFQEDNWNDLQLMAECDDCEICLDNCPTGSISANEFVINVDRCVALYNEIGGTFPEWLDADSHSALMGCTRCQEKCPANIDAIKRIIQSESISEKETEAILKGSLDEAQKESVSLKLKGAFTTKYKDSFDILTRNLKVLIEQ